MLALNYLRKTKNLKKYFLFERKMKLPVDIFYLISVSFTQKLNKRSNGLMVKDTSHQTDLRRNLSFQLTYRCAFSEQMESVFKNSSRRKMCEWADGINIKRLSIRKMIGLNGSTELPQRELIKLFTY